MTPCHSDYATLIKCLKGHKFLGSLCSIVKYLIVCGAGPTNDQGTMSPIELGNCHQASPVGNLLGLWPAKKCNDEQSHWVPVALLGSLWNIQKGQLNQIRG